MDLSNIIYLYQSKLISKFEIFSNLLRGKKVEERHYEKGACIICEWNQKIKKKKKIGRHKPQSIVYLEKITLSIGNLLKNFLTKMSKGRLKKCHLPTTMPLSKSYYNIEMVLFMLHALLLLFFFFFGFQMKWENKTYECVRLLRPPASHVDPSDMEAKHTSTGTETESQNLSFKLRLNQYKICIINFANLNARELSKLSDVGTNWAR